MKDEPMLTPEEIETLRGLKRWIAADWLLTGKLGPLERMGMHYPPITSALAYLITLAYLHGRAGGILKGRPGWEAYTTLGHRVHAVASRSAGLEEFGSLLFRSVNCEISRLTTDDILWWLQLRTIEGTDETWSRIRRRQNLEDALAASRLLRDLLYELKEGTK